MMMMMQSIRIVNKGIESHKREGMMWYRSIANEALFYAPESAGRTGYRARLTHKELKQKRRIEKLELKASQPTNYVRKEGVFRKNDLLSRHYAEILANSTLSLFVHGTFDQTQAKNDLVKAGFSVSRVQASLLKSAAITVAGIKNSANDSAEVVDGLSCGMTSLISFQGPLLDVMCDGNTQKILKKYVPLDVPKDNMYKIDQQILIGAFLVDPEKTNSCIWLSRAGFSNLVKSVASFNVQSDSGFTVHELFYGNLKSSLQTTLGSIRRPLNASLRSTSDTMNKILMNGSGVFSKVKHLRETEAK